MTPPRDPKDRSGLKMPPHVLPRLRLVEGVRDEIGTRAGRALADENQRGIGGRRQHIRDIGVRAMKGRATPMSDGCNGYKWHRWARLDKKRNLSYCTRCGLIVKDLNGLSRKVVNRDRTLIVGKVNGRTCSIRHEQRLAYGSMLAERDGGWICFYCRKPLDAEDDSTWTLDHYIPRNRGGTDELSNLRLSCPPCNWAKKDKMPEGVLGRPEEAPASEGLPLSLGIKKRFVRA